MQFWYVIYQIILEFNQDVKKIRFKMIQGDLLEIQGEYRVSYTGRTL